MDQDTPAKKQVNWYSGWRLFATVAATVVSAKLIGILGSLVAGLLFLWLQPKRGTAQAAAIAAVAGLIVAAVYSAIVLSQFADQQPQPAASADKSFTYEEAIGLPAPKR